MEKENRFEAGLKAIKDREQRFATLFSSHTANNRIYKQERLQEYTSLVNNTKGKLSVDERLYKRLVNAERRKLLRELYPSAIVRLLRSFVKLVVLTPVKAGVDFVKATQNHSHVNDFLKKANLEILTPLADLKMKQGKDEFNLNGSQFIENGKIVSYSINFKKDNSGIFQPNNYIASLTDQAKPDQHIKISMPSEEMVLDPRKAFNLLAGRAVFLPAEKKGQQDIWLQMDFNDKDAQGNHRVKQINTGYDLAGALNTHNVKELTNPLLQHEQIKQLHNGEKVQFDGMVNGIKQKLFVQAAPGKQGVEFLNVNSEKINPEMLGKGKKSNKAKEVSLKEEPKAKRTTLKVHRG
ncbi:MAG: hypothetical protein P0Y49_09470 [Candidatus Pedobacter colombiensis]|uniref:DUF3945 domain-containing protein n=1 Tax=Candidatus Pedobacter colombiensis TaxID=3121371 RepID=A0AAJ5WBF2_9SPHI|nr:hypothetical protein [Pedobacter sp.]WEK21369.1 MAG: hypothetical protein P0Y49_09470 [Pedobacter sp.]